MDETEPLIGTDSHTREIDFTNRDPKEITKDMVEINFEDVIAEPAGIHSLDCVWKISFKIYTWLKYICYCSLTIILGVPLSLLWGLLFACLSFWHIWAVVPCAKSCLIAFQFLIRPFCLVVRRIFLPFLEALETIFNTVKLLFRKKQ